MLRVVVAALLAILLVGGSVAWGQAPKKGDAKTEAPQAKPSMPPPEQLAILVQTAVVAASQANLTGNYTVLHALAAPSFQQANPPEKLAQVFAQWREKKIDLTPVIIFSPQLKHQPVIDDKNMLRLTGFYTTRPQQVHFDLLFQPVGGQWRLFGINLSTQAAGGAPKAAGPAAAPAPAGSEKKAPAAKK